MGQQYKRAGASVDVQRHDARPHLLSCRNCILPLMWRPNTDSAPNKPVTWPPNFWYVTRSRAPFALSRYGVTLPTFSRRFLIYFPVFSLGPDYYLMRVKIESFKNFNTQQQWRTSHTRDLQLNNSNSAVKQYKSHSMHIRSAHKFVNSRK